MTPGPASVPRPRGPLSLGDSRWPLGLLAAVLCLGVSAPAVHTPRADTSDESMPVAGGTSRLLRVAGIRVPVEPARALRVLVRVAHGAWPPDRPARRPPFGPYLAAAARLHLSLPTAGDPRADGPFLEACGLVRDATGVHGRRSRAFGERHQLLLEAGFPVDDWAEALSRGDPVAVDVGVDHVPTLLPRAVWEQAVFGRAVPVSDLAGAILDDRRAALVYHGLQSLDEDTLALLARSPTLVSAIHQRAAARFAAFGDSIAVRDGQVIVPGGAAAAPLWEALAGAPVSRPDRFIPALLGRDGGRLAWFFDTVARTDPARQAFALGPAPGSAGARAHAEQVYATFAGFQRRAWSIDARPFGRAAVDPAFALQLVAATPDGRMAPPNGRRFWEAALGGSRVRPAGEAEGGDVQAAWLLAELAEGSSAARRARLNAVLFAQRVAAARTGSRGVAPPADVAAFSTCVAAFPSHQMLLASLERLGLTEPRDCIEAVRAAGALAGARDWRASTFRLAAFQGTFAMIVRLAEVGTLDGQTARGLARGLFGLPADPGVYAAALADWLEARLAPALARQIPPEPAGTLEGLLLDGLAGMVIERPVPVIEWESHRYRVDPAAGARLRLRQIRRRQGGPDLDAALAVARGVAAVRDRRSSTAAVSAESAALADLVPAFRPAGGHLFGFAVSDLLEATVSAARAIEADAANTRGDPASAGADHAARLVAGLEVALASVLTSYAYAIAIGDPDSAVVLAGNPAHTHDFGLGATADQTGPWDGALAQRSGAASVLRGSLLGLEGGLSFTWLRATTQALPPRAPTIDPQDVRGFGELVAALTSTRPTDRGRDWILAALRRGRQRLAASAEDPAALDRLLVLAGVEPWRRRVIRQAPFDAARGEHIYLSLGEVLALGIDAAMPPDVHAWGCAQRAADGSLRLLLPTRLAWGGMRGRGGSGLLPTRVADLQLRVLEHLEAAGLPASLLPGVVARVAWEVARNVQVADADDWLPVIRAAQALTADRVADHVAALTHDGPMVPVVEARQDRVRAGQARAVLPEWK